jgi:hypothetical protein
MRILNSDGSDGFDELERQLLPAASSADRMEAFVAQRMLELVRFLHRRGQMRTAIGMLFFPELWLSPFPFGNKVNVTVWVDWVDYSPAKDGLPLSAYYRLDIKRDGAALSHNERVHTPEEVERVLWDAFGWGR